MREIPPISEDSDLAIYRAVNAQRPSQIPKFGQETVRHKTHLVIRKLK
jgi:hypothetical protein